MYDTHHGSMHLARSYLHSQVHSSPMASRATSQCRLLLPPSVPRGHPRLLLQCSLLAAHQRLLANSQLTSTNRKRRTALAHSSPTPRTRQLAHPIPALCAPGHAQPPPDHRCRRPARLATVRPLPRPPLPTRNEPNGRPALLRTSAACSAIHYRRTSFHGGDRANISEPEGPHNWQNVPAAATNATPSTVQHLLPATVPSHLMSVTQASYDFMRDRYTVLLYTRFPAHYATATIHPPQRCYCSLPRCHPSHTAAQAHMGGGLQDPTPLAPSRASAQYGIL